MSKDSEAFFRETFKIVSSDPRKFEYRLQNHAFSIPEKRVLRGLLYLKKGKKEKAYQELKCDPLANSFLEATRRFVLGMTHLNFGVFRFAVEHLEKSIQIYESINEPEFILYPVLNLAIAYGNQKDMDAMAKFVDQAAEYPTTNPYLEMLSYQAKAFYYVESGITAKARAILKSPRLLENKFYPWFKPTFDILNFGLNFKLKRFSDCFEILETYKKCNGYTVKANYLYMDSLLNHIVNSAPLYVYESELKEFPELFHQLEVIKALARGDAARAEKFWKLLHQNNPKIYQKGFHYAGEVSLFSVALAVHREQPIQEFDPAVLDKKTDLLSKLEYIFETSTGPVLKDQLVMLIWNEEASLTSLSRLRQLVLRYNQKKSTKILSRQDAYFLKRAA